MSNIVPIYIPTQVAHDLVDPHPLGEVLQSMQKMGLIQQFFVGEDLVRIFTTNRKRFEIADLFKEISDPTSTNEKIDNRKKLSSKKSER